MRPPHETTFWQLLLAGELSVRSLEQFEAHLHALSESEAVQDLMDSCILSEAERTRIRKAQQLSLRGDIGNHCQVLVRSAFPAHIAEHLPHVPALWVRGDTSVLERPRIGIVGTRQASPYGKAAAMKFAEDLAKAGASIVSGGAFGIDAAAHEGALKAGQTIAVLPNGVDNPYPASHKALYTRILARGCLVSQFGLGSDHRREKFLLRNATIAALSQALIVIEAPEKSGALSTAARANEMGRPVYVVPGPMTHATFRGSHDLIRSGATLVDHPDQVLEDLDIMAGVRKATAIAPISGPMSLILRELGPEPISQDKLIANTGLDASMLASELTLLELEGRIIRHAGGICLAP